jgi:hypothetical protein
MMAVAVVLRTRTPAPTPDSAAQLSLATTPHGGPLGPRRHRRARPRMGMTAPPDGEDFAPHLVELIIGHIADRHGSA